MTKQTARNNEFLKHVKETYNAPTFKKITVLVNEDKEDLAKYMIDTKLSWYVDGDQAAEKLMEMNYKPNGKETIEELFTIAGLL